MKSFRKITASSVVIAMLISLLSFNAFAAGEAVTFSAAQTSVVNAGDKVVVTMNMSPISYASVSGNLSYDS